MIVKIYSSSFRNMVKLYLKEEGLWRRYENVPAFVAKATKGIKKKIGKKRLA